MLIATAVFAGCGNGSSSNAAATDESSAPLTKKEFVKQAEEICQKEVKAKEAAVTGAAKLAAESGRAPTSKDLGKVVEIAVIPHYAKIIDQLSELSPPSGDEAQVKKVIGEFETALQSVEAEPAKATQSNPFTPADKVAEAYGIENCRL